MWDYTGAMTLHLMNFFSEHSIIEFKMAAESQKRYIVILFFLDKHVYNVISPSPCYFFLKADIVNSWLYVIST